MVLVFSVEINQTVMPTWLILDLARHWQSNIVSLSRIGRNGSDAEVYLTFGKSREITGLLGLIILDVMHAT